MKMDFALKRSFFMKSKNLLIACVFALSTSTALAEGDGTRESPYNLVNFSLVEFLGLLSAFGFDNDTVLRSVRIEASLNEFEKRRFNNDLLSAFTASSQMYPQKKKIWVNLGQRSATPWMYYFDEEIFAFKTPSYINSIVTRPDNNFPGLRVQVELNVNINGDLFTNGLNAGNTANLEWNSSVKEIAARQANYMTSFIKPVLPRNLDWRGTDKVGISADGNAGDDLYTFGERGGVLLFHTVCEITDVYAVGNHSGVGIDCEQSYTEFYAPDSDRRITLGAPPN